MNSFFIAIIKMAIAILLMAIAFWPNGLGTYVVSNFEQMPAGYSAIVALWVAAVALNLPLSRTAFTKVSTGSIAVMFAAIIYKLWQRNHFDPTNSQAWIIAMIFFVGFTIGWWTVSAKVWRWYRGLTPVDDADTGEGEV